MCAPRGRRTIFRPRFFLSGDTYYTRRGRPTQPTLPVLFGWVRRTRILGLLLPLSLSYASFLAVATTHFQVATLRASQVASARRQSATLLVLASVALAVAVAAGVVKGVYGYAHGDVPSFALGLAVAVVPALLVWALPHLAFAPRRARGRGALVPGTPLASRKQLLQ